MLKRMVSLAVVTVCATGSQMAAAQASDVSKVQLWGIVDAAIRHTNNEGAERDKKTQMIGGGMSQSRWGIKVEESLGGGTKALVDLENRFTTDDGNTTPGNVPFFQLAYVGLQGPFGRLTMGRQWNVLFDVVTSTYASFPYSPYMDAYKPELGMAVGARSSNSLKYLIANSDRSWVGALQYAFDEGNDAVGIQQVTGALAQQAAMGGAFTSGVPISQPQALGLLNSPLTPTSAAMVDRFVASYAVDGSALSNQVRSVGTGAIKNFGGYLRWSNKVVSLGGGFLRTELPAGSDLDAWTLGGSYRSGPLYVNLGYGENKVKYGGNTIASYIANLTDRMVLDNYWGGQTNGGFKAGDADKRKMSKIGFGYQATPQINFGAHYYHAKQSGSTSGQSNGKADFLIVAANYALSKRTDAYAAVDHTKLKGGVNLYLDEVSKATKRTGMTMGIRHRF